MRQRRKIIPKRCAAAGCSNTFVPKKLVPWAKFCSPACRHREYMRRRRIREGRPQRYGTRYDTCPHGHDRSPENTYVNPKTGRYSCRVCSREAEARRYRENEKLRQKKIQRERDRRARLRAERMAT